MAAHVRRSEAIWIEKKKYWEIKVQKNGRRSSFRSSRPGRVGKHEAEGKADDWLESGKVDMKFAPAWKLFLEHQGKCSGDANYAQCESLGRLWIVPTISASIYIDEITPAMWGECVEAPFVKKGLSRRTCKNVRNVISSFISFARRERWRIDKLERGDVVAPRRAKVGSRTILQPESLRKLFTVDYITKWKRRHPSFFIHAWRFEVSLGLRRGELCGIRRSDIVDGVLHIQRSVNAQDEETPGKNDNANRYILLPKISLSVIEDQMRMLRRAGIVTPWLFPDEHGERLDSNHLYNMWTTFRDQHELKCSLHELRNTFVSFMKNDMPDPLLKATVGHSSDMDTIGVYGRQTTDDMRRAADIIDSVFDRILGKSPPTFPPT